MSEHLTRLIETEANPEALCDGVSTKTVLTASGIHKMETDTFSSLKSQDQYSDKRNSLK